MGPQRQGERPRQRWRWRSVALIAVSAGAIVGVLTGESSLPVIESFKTRDLASRNANVTAGADEVPVTEPCAAVPGGVPRAIFHPLRFFEEGDGRGQAFLRHAQLVWLNYSTTLRPRFLLYESNRTRQDIGKEEKEDTQICHYVYLHIHKNGGTTVDAHTPFPVQKFYANREHRLGREMFDAKAEQKIQSVYGFQSKPESNTSVRVYTFLRDPVDRFLSALSQVLRRPTVVVLSPCPWRNSTVEFLDCVLTGMEQSTDDNRTKTFDGSPKFNATYPEAHLMPQSYELYRQMHGLDIAVDVMDLAYLDSSLQHFGVTKVDRKRAVAGSASRQFPNLILSRKALTSQQIRRICQLYVVDVIMLREVGVTESLCFAYDLNEPPSPRSVPS